MKEKSDFLHNTHKSAVVLIPPEVCWPPIQAIRREHDRHLRRWMPHITLLYPFRPRDEFAALTEPLRDACRSFEPFDIQLNSVRSFRHGRGQYTLWLAPEPAETVVALQTALWQVVPDCDDVRRFGNGFTPHLSVGQIKGKTQMEQLREQLQAAWRPLSFIVKEISLIRRNQPPDDVFNIAGTVRLGE